MVAASDMLHLSKFNFPCAWNTENMFSVIKSGTKNRTKPKIETAHASVQLALKCNKGHSVDKNTENGVKMDMNTVFPRFK